MELARAAAQARLVHWDGVVALVALSHAADAWLADDDLKVDYILDNLVIGPGVPAPGQLIPERHSALTNVAVGRYYYSQAQEGPPNAEQLLGGAVAHSKAAVQRQPAWATAAALAEDLNEPAPSSKPATAEAADLGECAVVDTELAEGVCAR